MKTLIFILALVFTQCKAPQDTSIKFGQNFTLPKKGSAVIGKELTVGFNDILEDSRCPTGLNCIWAGDVIVEVDLISAQFNNSKIKLNTKNTVTPLDTLGYTFKLIKVDPYPAKDVKINPQDYRVTLNVNKK